MSHRQTIADLSLRDEVALRFAVAASCVQREVRDGVFDFVFSDAQAASQGYASADAFLNERWKQNNPERPGLRAGDVIAAPECLSDEGCTELLVKRIDEGSIACPVVTMRLDGKSRGLECYLAGEHERKRDGTNFERAAAGLWDAKPTEPKS